MGVTTLNKLAYDLLELRRSTIKDTDDLDIRQIYEWIHQNRARRIKQKLEKPMYIPDSNLIQDIGTIQLESIDISSLTNYPLNKYIKRTIIDIPATIESKDGAGNFTRISGANIITKRFNVVTYERALSSGNGMFNKNDIFAFYRDHRVYIISSNNDRINGITHLYISGLFQNPVEAALIKDISWDEDCDYPINMELVSDLRNMILSELFKLVYIKPIDNIADEQNNIVSVQKI